MRINVFTSNYPLRSLKGIPTERFWMYPEKKDRLSQLSQRRLHPENSYRGKSFPDLYIPAKTFCFQKTKQNDMQHNANSEPL